MNKSIQLNRFLAENKPRTLQYLKNAFPILSEEDTEDVFQDSSLALYLNILEGKLTKLTSSLYTYFLRICINLSHKLIYKRGRMLTVAIDDGGKGCKAIPFDMLEQVMMDDDDSESQRIEEHKQHLVGAIVVPLLVDGKVRRGTKLERYRTEIWPCQRRFCQKHRLPLPQKIQGKV